MFWERVGDWIETQGPNVLAALGILIVGYLVAVVAKRIVRRVLARARVDTTITGFVAGLVYFTILVLAIVSTLARFGVETASFVALFGALAFAIGFALQGALANFAAGLLILVFRPYKVGDYIGAAPHKGKFSVKGTVSEIQLFTTEVITADNIQLLVPNGIIFANTIKNYSARDRRRSDLAVEVARSAPIGESIRLLEEVARSDRRVLAEPAAEVVVSALKEKSVTLLVRFWVAPQDSEAVEFNLARRAKDVLDANGKSA